MSALSLKDGFRLLLIGLILAVIALVSWEAIGADGVHPHATSILAVLLLTSIKSREAMSYVRFRMESTKKRTFWDSSVATIGMITTAVILSLLLQYVRFIMSYEPEDMFVIIAGIFIIFIVGTNIADIMRTSTTRRLPK